MHGGHTHEDDSKKCTSNLAMEYAGLGLGWEVNVHKILFNDLMKVFSTVINLPIHQLTEISDVWYCWSTGWFSQSTSYSQTRRATKVRQYLSPPIPKNLTKRHTTNSLRKRCGFFFSPLMSVQCMIGSLDFSSEGTWA